MKIERIQFLIDPNMYDTINKYIQKKINYCPYYKRDIYNKNEKIATLTIKKNEMSKNINFCILSFYLETKTIEYIISKRDELSSIYSLYDKYKDIIYCVQIEKDIPLNKEVFLNKFHIYDWRIKNGDMEFIKSLVQYTDMSNKLEMCLLLYCLIYNMEKVKLDINLMDYIEKKFSYYGYNISNDSDYKINFEEKLNTYFSLEDELPLNSNSYYEMFYELFKYLWNLKTIIDTEEYAEKDFYFKIRIYFEKFVVLLNEENYFLK